MLDDRQLLRQYAENGAESAFAELVARHVNLVYSVALRVGGGDPQLAEDAAQLVFSDLARKVRRLPRDTVLAGWLHRATKYAAIQLRRAERRRHTREQRALATQTLESTSPPSEWHAIRPLLDEALDRLDPTDRDALLLRFFEQNTLGEVGRALGTNEEAARKRVSRALEKLRAYFVRRGVPTSAAALAIALSTCAMQSAPAGLASTLAGASLAATGAVAGSTVLPQFMTMTKLKIGLCAGLLAAGVTTPLVIQRLAQARWRAENDALRGQIGKLEADNEVVSNSLRSAQSSQSLGAEQFAELMKLRGQFRLLSEQSNSLARLKDENLKLHSALSKAAENNPSSPAEGPEEEQKRRNTAKMHYIRDWAVALSGYAINNNSLLPASSDRILALAPDQTNAKYHFDPNQFEITYQGSLKDLGATAEFLFILREIQPYQTEDGTWHRTYGFADGHAQVISSLDGDFATAEQKNSVRLHPPPAGQ